MNTKTKLLNRNEQSKESKWKLEHIFSSDTEWEKEFKEIKELCNEINSFKNKLASSEEKLLSCLKLKDRINSKLESVYVYANMRFHENMTNTTYQSLSDRSQSLSITVSSSISFVVPEILSIDEKTITSFIKSSKELQFYEFYLKEILRNKQHILSLDEEVLLAKASVIGQSPQTIYSMFNNADIEFSEVTTDTGENIQITQGNFIKLLENKDRHLRKLVFELFYKSYSKQKNTLAAIYDASVKSDVFFAHSRNYTSALEASLKVKNIDLSVYDQLIEAVNDNIHLMHKYIALRKKMLHLDEIHMYDLYTPMVKDVDMTIPFEEAKKIILEGLASLGEDYLERLQTGFDNQWIDIYENKGKKSGAYSWGCYESHPFVLMNYQDNINNLFTLAHEMGHALHSNFSNENQEYLYSGYEIFLAEVASTVNETLLIKHLLKTTVDPKKRLYLINYYLDQFKSTVYRQTMFAEFEKITHEMVEKNEPLNQEVLCKTYHDLNIKYYGNDIVIDEEIDIEWARIPHFYNAFYVYQYATGFSAAIALSDRIINEGQVAVDDYLAFLKSGSCDYALNILKKAGVDMTTKSPIENALKTFENLLDEMGKAI